MNHLDALEMKKIDRIKDLLETDPEDRTEKMLLELMSFTRVFFKINDRNLDYLKILRCLWNIKIYVKQ
jgi:hypothetical protein